MTRTRGWLALWCAMLCAAGCGAASLPGPDGLVACRPEDGLERSLGPATANFGNLLACYTSSELTHHEGAPAGRSVHTDYAIAIDVMPSAGPYSHQDVEQLFAKTSEQWANFKPLDSSEWSAYVDRLNAMLATTGTQVQPEPPSLVSIERVGDDAYLVVSIRQRIISREGTSARSIAVESAGIVLRGRSLIRLIVHRELRAPSDIALVHDRTKSWLQRLQ